MIIYRSFVSQVFKMTLVVTFVIVCLFLVLRGMIFLGQAAEGLIPVSAVLSLVSLAMVANLDVILPLMAYIGLLMVLNRWYNDREMAVIASTGIGIIDFLKPLLVINLFMFALISLFSFYVTPLALTAGYDLEKKYRQSNKVNGIQTGRFVEAMNGNTVYFVEAYSRSTGQYENVFINQTGVNSEGLVKAAHAYRLQDKSTQDQFLVLTDGTRYEGTAGSTDYQILDFEKYALRIEPPKAHKLYLPARAQASVNIMNSKNAQYRGEWIWRIGKIFILPVLSIFALALSHVDSRTGKAKGLIMAFLIYLVYSNALAFAVAYIKKQQSNSSLPVWGVHFFFLTIAFYCLYRRNYNLALLPSLPRRLQKTIVSLPMRFQ